VQRLTEGNIKEIRRARVGKFSEGLAPAKKTSLGKWGSIDKKGNIIKQWSFDPNELMKDCHPPLNPNASYQVEPPADSLPALEVGEDTGIEYPQIIKRVSPEYPKDAVEKNVQGPVSLSLELDIYGRVISARAFKGPELLRAAAEKAIKQWVFAPSIIDGVPRRVKMTVTLNFKI
jgi:TonB family protein